MLKVLFNLLLSADSSVQSDKCEIRQSSVSWQLEVLDDQQINCQAEAFLDMEEESCKFGDNYASAVELWRDHRMADIDKGASSTIELLINEIKIGSLNLVFLNAEVFSSFVGLIQSAQWNGETNPGISRDEHYCLITCANGVVGYLPDIEQCRSG
ncbi:MAG: hypothetical protein U9N86_18745 [Bacteroidota bacterium]|nr:hypothetical protein [Bacteroidota bacterium]